MCLNALSGCKEHHWDNCACEVRDCHLQRQSLFIWQGNQPYGRPSGKGPWVRYDD